jgi:hypothetical protein
MQCLIKNQLRCDNPGPSHVLYLELGSADDSSQNQRRSDAHDYDYLTNHDLNLEHGITDDTSPSKYDMDAGETYCTNVQSKDTKDIIEKTDWGEYAIYEIFSGGESK